MSTGDPAQRAALLRLGASTAEAIAQVLEMFAPGEISRGEVTVLDTATSPFAGTKIGSVAAGVSYIDGVTGANVFIAPLESARTLAAKMGAAPEDDADEDALSDFELSAVSEAANQMMAAAASAISVVLGQEIEISPPTTSVMDDPSKADSMFGSAPHAVSTSFMIAGEPCRLIQLIPSAFVVKVARALDEMDGDARTFTMDDSGGAGQAVLGITEALSGIKLRVWAELGRTILPLGEALDLPLGAVVELDRATEAPVDLFVNGLRFAHGRLMVSDDNRWVFELDELLTGQTSASLTALAA